MQLQVGEFCPLIKKDCVQLKCKFFTKIAGHDMNTGKEIEEWNCALAFLPMLLIENAGTSRQTSAAVESFRNEMVNSNSRMQQAMFHNLIKQREEEQRRALPNGGDK